MLGCLCLCSLLLILPPARLLQTTPQLSVLLQPRGILLLHINLPAVLHQLVQRTLEQVVWVSRFSSLWSRSWRLRRLWSTLTILLLLLLLLLTLLPGCVLLLPLLPGRVLWPVLTVLLIILCVVSLLTRVWLLLLICISCWGCAASWTISIVTKIRDNINSYLLWLVVPRVESCAGEYWTLALMTWFSGLPMKPEIKIILIVTIQNKVLVKCKV